jgi:hypothetical protein
MGRKGFEGIFNLHIVNLFTPNFVLPRQWGGKDLMDFLVIVKFFTPTFDLPCKIGKMAWEKIENRHPHLLSSPVNGEEELWMNFYFVHC